MKITPDNKVSTIFTQEGLMPDGIYRFAANFKSIEPVFLCMDTPNGIALSPDGNTLWVTETNRNQLVSLNFQPNTNQQ